MNAAAAPDLWEEIVNACTFYQVPAEVKEAEVVILLCGLCFAFSPETALKAGAVYAAIALVVRKALDWLNSGGNVEA
nr:hypothetical protein [uncultured Blautia sp.]